MKHVSGIVCYVADLAITKNFYGELGFSTERKAHQIALSLGSFWIDCIAVSSETKANFQTEAQSPSKGGGLYLYIEVDDVDRFYADIVEKGMKPSSEPEDWPWGNREFVLRDPDGYKLVFFNKTKIA